MSGHHSAKRILSLSFQSVTSLRPVAAVCRSLFCPRNWFGVVTRRAEARVHRRNSLRKEIKLMETPHHKTSGSQIYKPSAKQRRNVQAMAVSGIPPLDIAKHLGLPPKLLRDHFRKVLDRQVIPPLTAAQERKYKAQPKVVGRGNRI
jgi:hypothetical protein